MSEEKLLVLVVEDDEQLNKALCVVLEDVYDVEGVYSLHDAKERITQEPILDCILLDLMLPNGLGVDLVDKFQNDCPAIPIVVISGYAVSEEAILEAGAQAILMKPVSGDEVRKKIAEVLNEWNDPKTRLRRISHCSEKAKKELASAFSFLNATKQASS